MDKRKNVKKQFTWLFIVTLMLSLLVGCSGQNSQPQTQQAQQEKTVKDSLGREIKVEQPPKKIISLAPADTEILFALGLDQEIIGVSDYCDYPSQAKTKPKMGGYQDPNVELISSKQPDMVFISAGVQENVIKKLEDFKIKVVVLDADTIQQVMNNIELAGVLTGKATKAKQITADIKTRMDAVVKKVQGLPKPKVFFEVWDDPLMSAGSQSFINNMIETAGGNNIAATNTERYYNYSMETLFKENPDIYILNTHSHTPEDVKARNGFQALKAVQNNKVYIIDDNLISRAGPRVILGLEQMAKIIHPEAFKS